MDFKKAAEQADKLEEIRAEQARVTDMLTDLKAAERELEQNFFQELSIENGITEFEVNGRKVKITNSLKTSINKDHKGAAMQWLEDNPSSAGLLKPEIVIPLNSVGDFDDAVARIGTAMPEKQNSITMKSGIHPATLVKFGQEMQEAGQFLPEQLFNTATITKVSVK